MGHRPLQPLLLERRASDGDRHPGRLRHFRRGLFCGWNGICEPVHVPGLCLPVSGYPAAAVLLHPREDQMAGVAGYRGVRHRHCAVPAGRQLAGSHPAGGGAAELPGVHLARYRRVYPAPEIPARAPDGKLQKAVRQQQQQKGYHHKCAVCGRTDTDYPDLQFRYCSKCVGYRCFCQDHIFSHVHFTEEDQ